MSVSMERSMALSMGFYHDFSDEIKYGIKYVKESKAKLPSHTFAPCYCYTGLILNIFTRVGTKPIYFTLKSC